MALRIEQLEGEEQEKIVDLVGRVQESISGTWQEVSKVQLTPEVALIINNILEGETCWPQVYLVDNSTGEPKIIAGYKARNDSERPYTILEAYHMARKVQELGVDVNELKRLFPETASFGEEDVDNSARFFSYCLTRLERNGAQIIKNLGDALQSPVVESIISGDIAEVKERVCAKFKGNYNYSFGPYR